MLASISSRALRSTFSTAPSSRRAYRTLIDTPSCLVLSRAVNAFQMNQHCVICRSTNVAALVDCGDPDELWAAELEEHGATITQIFQTHAHIDHVLGLAAAKRAHPAVPIYLHLADLPLYEAVNTHALSFGLTCEKTPPVDVELQHGDVLAVGDLQLTVHHTPGHAPGHVIFHCESEEFIIGGDLIFQGGIGRTDLPMCDGAKMQESLQYVAKSFLPETHLFPGHMGPTTLGEELSSNPFLRGMG